MKCALLQALRTGSVHIHVHACTCIYVHVYPSGFIFCVGIPALVILDKDGKTINASGRAAISADPEGKVNTCAMNIRIYNLQFY